jgi:hypothetical protein
MYPPLAADIIAEYSKPGDYVLDPFMGSGTTPISAVMMDRRGYGYDINPYAVLIASARASMFKIDPTSTDRVLREVHQALSRTDELVVPIPPLVGAIRQRYNKHAFAAMCALAHILNDIQAPVGLDAVLSLCLAETGRYSANIKHSENKTNAMPAEQQAKFSPRPLETFMKLLTTYLEILSVAHQRYAARGHRFNELVIGQNDLMKYDPGTLPVAGLIVTSPPYGDSKTTVGYGDFSSIGLRWLNQDPTGLDSTMIGGFARAQYRADIAEFAKAVPEKSRGKVGAFLTDLATCVDHMLGMTKVDGHIAIVIGDRTTGGVKVPTSVVIETLATAGGAVLVDKTKRTLQKKRSSPKNSPTNVAGVVGDTMADEVILVFQKRRES